MQKNNKILTIFSTLLFILSSCGTTKNKISVFIYAKDDTFISSLTTNLIGNLNATTYKNELFSADRSQSTQNEQLTKAIESEENNLLIVNTVDRLADGTIMDKAKLYNLPIIFFNREPLDDDLSKSENCYYVGSNPMSEGLLQAKMAEEIFGPYYSLDKKYDKNGDNKIQCIVLKGEQGHQDMENRSKYCISGLKNDNYGVEILTTAYCNWKRSEGYTAMSDIYKEYGDSIELVFSNNDDMALGAVDYLLDQKVFKSDATDVSEQAFPVLGVDATDVCKEAIKNHLIYGTIKNDAVEQAKAISTLANYLLESKTIDETFPYRFISSKKIYIEGSIVEYANL